MSDYEKLKDTFLEIGIEFEEQSKGIFKNCDKSICIKCSKTYLLFNSNEEYINTINL